MRISDWSSDVCSSDLAAIATANALPTVSVIHPQSAAAGTFTLPGTVAAYNEAAINARTSGYVAKWYADIGDHVRAGQVLAVLDAPEVSEQLAQARGALQSNRKSGGEGKKVEVSVNHGGPRTTK